MKNFVSVGEDVTVSAPYALSPGQGCLAGSAFGVGTKTASLGDTTDIRVQGEFLLTANSSASATAGAIAYWDDANRRVDTSGSVAIGVFSVDKAGGDSAARVRLVPNVGGGGAAAAASTLVPLSTTLAGDFNTPLLQGSSMLPPLSHYPKRRNLGIFTTAAAALTTFGGTGGSTKADSTELPYIGNQGANSWPTNTGGSPVASMVVGGTCVAIPSSTALPARDLTGHNVYVAFRVLPNGGQSGLQIPIGFRLYNGTSPSSGAATNFARGDGRVDYVPTWEWQVLSWPVEELTVTGTFDITQVTHAAIVLGTVTGVPSQVQLGGIWHCPKQLGKGAVIIGFDDNRFDTWSDASFELASRGFPGVLFPGAIKATLRSSIDQYQMTVDHLQTLTRMHGWEICGQAYSTENPAFDDDAAVQDMAQQRALFAAAGLKMFNVGSYFSNLNATRTGWKKAFKQNFSGMRGYNIGNGSQITAKQVTPETFPIGDPNYIRALGVDLNAHTLANLTQYVDYAIASKGLAIFIFHAVTRSNATQFAKYTGLLDYLDANRTGAEVCTLGRVFAQGYAFPL